MKAVKEELLEAREESAETSILASPSSTGDSAANGLEDDAAGKHVEIPVQQEIHEKVDQASCSQSVEQRVSFETVFVLFFMACNMSASSA